MMNEEQATMLRDMAGTLAEQFSEAIAQRVERTVGMRCPCGGCTQEVLLRVSPTAEGWKAWIQKPTGEPIEKAFTDEATMLREMAQCVLAMGWRKA